MKLTAKQAYAAATLGGALPWLLAAAIGGRSEAWDSPLYWLFSYPLSIGLAGGIGYWVPEKPWRWGLAVMLSQALVLLVSSDSFGLLPLGLIVFSILALPAIGLAVLMARVRLRSGKS